MRIVKDSGYSLLEVMIATFVAGMLSTLVVLTLPQRDSGARDAAAGLAAKLELARQTSAITGEIIGLRLAGAGYGFVRYRAGAWHEVRDHARLAFTPWPEGIRLVSPLLQREGGNAGNVPQIWFDLAGNPAPLEIILRHEEERFVIAADSHGTVRLADGT